MAHRTVACLTIIVLLAASTLAAQSADDAAQAAAEAWLKIVDTGNYALSHDEAATAFQKAVPQEKWTAALSSIRAPLGSLISRSLASREASDKLPGAPPGKYFTVRFSSAFANAPKFNETIMLVPDGERGWRVVGFTITPP